MTASLISSETYFEENKLFRGLLWTQATYTLITALWPLIDIQSFMAVTGPKHEVWLVKTIGALLIPVAATLYSYLFINTDRRPAMILGLLIAVTFATIDIYYVLSEVIPIVYLADAAVEVIFLTGWIYLALTTRHTNA